MNYNELVQKEKWSYEDIVKQEFYLIPACDYYVKNKNYRSAEK